MTKWCATKLCVKEGVSEMVGPSAPPEPWMSPSATPATQCGAAPQATNGDQARHQVQQVPRLPRQTQVDVSKCHTCHVKRRWMPPSATPATQNEGGCLQLPRLPRETKVDVTKCHTCHAKWRGAPGDQRRTSAPPSATSATPAIPNDKDVCERWWVTKMCAKDGG